MKKIDVYDYRVGEKEHHTLSAEIQDTGVLVLSGYDCGPSVEKFFGDFDYEYWLTVKAENVPSVLLNLIKDSFKSNVEFKKWLKDKGIPFDFKSF